MCVWLWSWRQFLQAFRSSLHLKVGRFISIAFHRRQNFSLKKKDPFSLEKLRWRKLNRLDKMAATAIIHHWPITRNHCKNRDTVQSRASIAFHDRPTLLFHHPEVSNDRTKEKDRHPAFWKQRCMHAKNK